MKLLLKYNYILIESRGTTSFNSDRKIAIIDSGMASQNLINCKICPAIKLRGHEIQKFSNSLNKLLRTSTQEPELTAGWDCGTAC